MATKAKKRGRKPGSKMPTKAERIVKLEGELTNAQVKEAKSLALNAPYDMLKLAFMTAVPPAASTSVVRGLGAVIKGLTPEKQAKATELAAAIRAL